jgi:PadR family transcriptional regulator, regulatory protein PadR
MPRPRREEMPAFYLSPLEVDLLQLLSGRQLYSVEIEQALKDSSGRLQRFGSLYPTLRGMVNRGLLSARWGDQEPEELGGPRRRYYTTTPLGMSALTETAKRHDRLKQWPLVSKETPF